MIVKGKKGDMTFDVSGAKMKEKVKAGSNVTVRYMEKDGKMMASSVTMRHAAKTNEDNHNKNNGDERRNSCSCEVGVATTGQKRGGLVPPPPFYSATTSIGWFSPVVLGKRALGAATAFAMVLGSIAVRTTTRVGKNGHDLPGCMSCV